MRVGILSLQGDFSEHRKAIQRLGEQVVLVRENRQLDELDAFILPGGESTTFSKLSEAENILEAVGLLIKDGMPVMATCAGLIVLASKVINKEEDQKILSVLDVEVVRNAYGSQRESFMTRLYVKEIEKTIDAIFIRAPIVTSVGRDVKVLASLDSHPVMLRQNNILAMTFHPELAEDLVVHEYFLQMIG